MASLEGMLASPNLPGLPEPPAGDFFDDDQWAVLMSLLDAAIPSIVPESQVADQKTQKGLPDLDYQKLVNFNQGAEGDASVDNSSILAYLQDRPSNHPEFLHACRKTLASFPASARKQLGAVLYQLR